LFYYDTNMLFRVDPHSPQSLGDQIAAQVRGAVVRGELQAGERLPSARELGAALGVNLHTVLRAYAVLRDEGVVELRRGRGAVVCAELDAARLGLLEQLRAVVAEARRLGLADSELTVLLEQARAWAGT
jgi:GntR family transcriptional regulator